ncbi:MAG: VOC family protein [Myxococcaceae bacterium]
MIDHFTLTVSDLAASRKFYDQALAPLGYRTRMDYGEVIGIGDDKKPYFWLRGGGKTPSLPMHIAFIAKDRPAVDAFYKAALAAGAQDDGPPGVRKHYHPNYYGAFVIDPDGHPIEAVCHAPATAAKKKAAAKKVPAKKKRK